jgi:chemotaxis protein CheD
MAVRSMLAYAKIPIKAQDTGLNYGRTLYFTTDDGVMTIKSFANGVKVY